METMLNVKYKKGEKMNQAEMKSIAAAYELSQDDWWLHPQSKKWIIKHDAVEKIASIEKIKFDLPIVASSDINNVALIISATYKDEKVWTMGEARKENCKMAYYWAMAEKRGKDRCVLKLLNFYEKGIYSDVEADDFNRSSIEQKIADDFGMSPQPKQEFQYGRSKIEKTQLASAKQISYIKHLLKQNDESEDKFSYDDMMADEASDIISSFVGGK